MAGPRAAPGAPRNSAGGVAFGWGPRGAGRAIRGRAGGPLTHTETRT